MNVLILHGIMGHAGENWGQWLHDDLMIVAHSLGVTSALDYIEDHNIKGLISVSGMARDYGMELNSYFLKEKDIDFDIVLRRTKRNMVIYGDNDPYVTQDALKEVADELGVETVLSL